MSDCLLKLQIGPVQDFIAQARSTRDLWSGSYLISWLMGHGLHALATTLGPRSVVFPCLADGDSPDRIIQPLVRWLRDERLIDGLTPEQVLTPNLPNILLAVVPESWDRETVQNIVIAPMHAEWDAEINACLAYYRRSGNGAFTNAETDLFNRQARRFWQITWQLWPCASPAEVLPLLRSIPETNGLVSELEALDAEQQRKADLDRDWAAQYALISHRLDARRQTREFAAWNGCRPLATRDKDSLSGREEAIADKAWLGKAKSHRVLRHRFRSADQLGAPNLIKRVWDLALLESRGLSRPPTYDSVPAVAAAPWLARLKGRLGDPEVETAVWRLVAEALAVEAQVPALFQQRKNGQTLEEWLDHSDAGVFHLSSWESWSEPEADQPPFGPDVLAHFAAAREATEHLYHVARIGKPGRYFAVLALDGDEMGTWLSGAKVPLTRQFHRSFSRQLAEYALRAVRPTIEQHYGQLIYAGGDDVLAMLPAETAIACARELARSFQTTVGTVAPGCTASVGVAMAHIKAPLQDVVASAQAAEKMAKKRLDQGGFGRNALAVELLKRSGEGTRWGAKFCSKAWPLLTLFQAHYRGDPSNEAAPSAISGRFPHVLDERLTKQGLDTQLSHDPCGAGLPSPLAIAEAEFGWVVERQTEEGLGVVGETALKALRERLRAAGRAYLDELAEEHGTCGTFLGLFATEAFLARQGE